MPEELKEVYRQYQDGKISRREFMQKTIIITGSLAAANSLVACLAPAGAQAIYDTALASQLIPTAVPVPKVMD
jgi:hypothetical protein